MESAKAESHDLCLALSDLPKDLQKKEEEVETMKEFIEDPDARHCEEKLKHGKEKRLQRLWRKWMIWVLAWKQISESLNVCQTQRDTIQSENVQLKEQLDVVEVSKLQLVEECEEARKQQNVFEEVAENAQLKCEKLPHNLDQITSERDDIDNYEE
jgi:hypothetical protein